MIAHVQEVFPAEGCGFLGGQHGRVLRVYPIQNLQHSSTSYLMHPAQQIRAWYDLHRANYDLLAIYHSHPHTAAWPSPRDLALHAYPNALQVIISLANVDQPQVRAFRLTQATPHTTRPLVQEVTFRPAFSSKE